MTQVELIRRSIIDDPATVAATVARVRRSGRLVDMTLPRRVPDGRVLVVVTLRPPEPQPVRPVKRRRWVKPVVIASAVLTPMAVVVALLVELARTVWAARTAVGGVLLLVAALVVAARLLSGHRATCAGLHCGGCRG
jgi:hypothetical protein